MTIYVAEIKGGGVAAFYANTVLDAETFRPRLSLSRRPHGVDDCWSAALPLWDGMTCIKIRQASPFEEAKWQRSRAKAIRHGGASESFAVLVNGLGLTGFGPALRQEARLGRTDQRFTVLVNGFALAARALRHSGAEAGCRGESDALLQPHRALDRSVFNRAERLGVDLALVEGDTRFPF